MHRAEDMSDDYAIDTRTVLIGLILLNIARWAFYDVGGMVIAKVFG